MNKDIDIAVCYHKEWPIFESDALKPMHCGKARSKLNLGIRGDDVGDNISVKNEWYAEETAMYWLWKNSDAKIKGIMHCRRLFDLCDSGKRDRAIILESIKEPRTLVSELGLDAKHISKLMENADVLVRHRCDLLFSERAEDRYKAMNIPEYWDHMMEIVRTNFPKIYPAATRFAEGHFAWWSNLVIMRADLFDAMCAFRFAVLEKWKNVLPKIIWQSSCAKW